MNHNISNLIAAIVLSMAIIFCWQHFVEKPKIQKTTEQQKKYHNTVKSLKEHSTQIGGHSVIDRNSAITAVPRLPIRSKTLSGSIALKGFRFDDLVLRNYRQALDKNSPNVELFSPSQSNNSYFAEIGWWSNDKHITFPDSSTIWQTDKSELTENQSVTLSWTSPENVVFKVTISLDENYMFTIKQTTHNQSGRPIYTSYYGLINRDYNSKKESAVNILHQGMIGSIAGKLQEISYDKIKENKNNSFPKSNLDWIGITDKYWLSAFIPDHSEQYNINYNYALKAGRDKYQSDFMTSSQLIEPNASYQITHRLFAGAKKLNLLDQYEKQYNINLFDRAVDFGWFYVLTKPIFLAMNFFYQYVGNFGISIMIVTVIIKLLLFTLANRSYRSMKKMKRLQPQMERLKELYAEDKVRLNQEIMQLYKREGVNPISGCLPLLVQIPVFFSIYKVLYVTIEMRQAPFFGWIKDLSAPDPTTIFNLFGLLSFTPPSMLMIGVWPLIMSLSMYLQQKMSPQPADPVQAQVMKFMPLIFLFMFSSFPAGLLIYWSWNNVLSIIQQYYINRLEKNDS